MKKIWGKMSQKNFIPNTLFFLIFQYFLVGRRDVRVPGTYFERTVYDFDIYIGHWKKPHIDKTVGIMQSLLF